MPPEPHCDQDAHGSKSTGWVLWTLTAVIVYVLGIGPLHGLYYNDRLSDNAWRVIGWIYLPVTALEKALPNGEPFHSYRYWWYILIKYHRPPVNGGPPDQGTNTT